MTRIYLYVVAASADPDQVDCVVPWLVDDELIFFGPCKKRIREEIRELYLSPTTPSAEVADPLYLIGVNASNSRHVRKVVWAGRISRVMTFATAYNEMTLTPRFRKLRDHPHSPLHLRPMYSSSGGLVGYEHISLEHDKGDAWIMDLIKSHRFPQVSHLGERLLLQTGASPWRAFPRDACFVLENIFFAQNEGLQVDSALVSILRRAQPGVPDVDAYAVFGRRRDGSIEGLTGRFLLIEEQGIVDDLLEWVESAKTRLRVELQS